MLLRLRPAPVSFTDDPGLVQGPLECNHVLLVTWVVVKVEQRTLTNRSSSSQDNRYELPRFGSKPSQNPWPPTKRQHTEHETSRSISGTYQLYDLLDLSTTSGSISVDIEVQTGDQPAVLRLATTSGSIRVKMTSGGGLFKKPFVGEAAKSRTINTEISTQSGSTYGDIVHGNGGSTIVSTHSGSMSITIYAVGVSGDDPQSTITTSSFSGSHNLKVIPPLGSLDPVRAIEASHTVRGSGSMNIDYPTQWEGMVHIQARGSGSVIASGQGLVVQRESHSELYGYRGEKEGRKVEIQALGSGSVRFHC